MKEQLSSHSKVEGLSLATATGTRGQFHKHFMLVNYIPSKISLTMNLMHVPMQHFQNALCYFVTVVS